MWTWCQDSCFPPVLDFSLHRGVFSGALSLRWGCHLINSWYQHFSNIVSLRGWKLLLRIANSKTKRSNSSDFRPNNLFSMNKQCFTSSFSRSWMKTFIDVSSVFLDTIVMSHSFFTLRQCYHRYVTSTAIWNNIFFHLELPLLHLPYFFGPGDIWHFCFVTFNNLSEDL